MLDVDAPRDEWESLGSEKEIADQDVPQTRPLLKIHYTRTREFFQSRQGGLKLSSREALECSTELRPFKDPTYDLAKQEHDIAIQAVTPLDSRVVQTPWHRRVETAVQAYPEAIDARVDFASTDLTDEQEALIPDLTASLEAVMPRVAHNLTQNEVVPIFVDDYANLQDDDSFVGHKEESFLREYQSFAHHKYTKGKKISSIDWQPKSSRNVAISVVEPIGFQERLALNRKVSNTMVIIWSFNDPIHPQFVLEAPNEVNVVRFNPSQPHMVAAGCVNGQVCLWDISKALEAVKSKTKKTGLRQGGPAIQPGAPLNPLTALAADDREDREDDANIQRIKWCQLSKIENGHKRSVNDLCWLQNGLESNFDGKLGPAPDELVNQFATISADGYLFIWDVRKENIRKDRLRKEAAKNTTGELPWIPLLKVQLTKVDGTGDIAGLRMYMESAKNNPYLMCCTTEDGEYVVTNWAPQEEKKEAPMPLEFGHIDKENKTPIKSVAQGHFGPGWSIQRHPIKEGLGEYYVTVGDWSFKIWHTGTAQPIVASPCGSAQMTCGRWSPTRPSILFIGTDDGFLQIWDLLDRSHEATLTQSVSQCALTSIEFRPSSDTRQQKYNQQLLAVGDEVGVLHIYELPRILIKPHVHEKKNMEKYLERELKRVNYFAVRWKVRQKELEELQARIQQEKLEAQLAAPLDDPKAPVVQPVDVEEENPFADEITFKQTLQDFTDDLEENDDL